MQLSRRFTIYTVFHDAQSHGMAWGINVQLWPFLTRHYTRRMWLAPSSSHLIHWIGSWQGPTAGVHALEKRRTLCLSRESNTSLARAQISVLTEVITCRGTAQRLVAGLSSRRPEFNSRPVYTRFVVNRVALGCVSVPLLCFSPVSITAPMAQYHSFIHSFIHSYITDAGFVSSYQLTVSLYNTHSRDALKQRFSISGTRTTGGMRNVVYWRATFFWN
jgi:hypothetical protein